MSENRLADEAQYFGALQDGVDSQQELIESLRQRVKELEDYLREVAVEAGLPPETLDIATCRHIAHQVKSLRLAAYQFMEEAEAERKRRWDGNADSSREIAELSRELAALKAGQGEPEIWVRDSGDGHWEFSEPGFGTPLYTSAPTIPEGWVMVPVEPTPEMRNEGREMYQNDGDELEIYQAMLAAAPKPEE